MLFVHKDIPHMPLVRIGKRLGIGLGKIFANKSSHYVASWYRQPVGSSQYFQLFRDQLDHIRTKHKISSCSRVFQRQGLCLARPTKEHLTSQDQC